MSIDYEPIMRVLLDFVVNSVYNKMMNYELNSVIKGVLSFIWYDRFLLNGFCFMFEAENE